MAKSKKKQVRGISENLSKARPTKALPEFSKAEQAKILRQQTIIQTLIDSLGSK